MGRTRTWPKIRPAGLASIHAANASRELVATPLGREKVSDKVRLPLRLAGAGDDEVRHRRVRADRGAVEDGLVLAHGDLPGQAEILGDGLAGVPALRYKDGDQDHVLRLYVRHDLPDLGLLIQEPNLDQIVDSALPDPAGIEVDDAAGTLVEVCPMPEQHERGAPRDLLATHEVLRPLEDNLGHPLEGSQRTRVAHNLKTFPRDGSLQTEFPGDDLLGEVTLGDEGRNHVDLIGLHGVQHVAHGGLLLPEALDDLVEFSDLPYVLGVLIDRQARVLVQVRAEPHDDEGLHSPRISFAPGSSTTAAPTPILSTGAPGQGNKFTCPCCIP